MNPIPVFTLLAIPVLMALLPRVTRPDLYFGATVDPAFRRTPEGRSIERQYWLWVAASTAAGIALLFLAPRLMVVPFIVGSTAGWAFSNRRTRRHARKPNAVREASLSSRTAPRGLLPAALGPFVILAAASIFMHLNWDRIPQRFPVHFGFDGPDRWADKSISSVYGMLGVGAAICAAILASTWMITGARRVAVTGVAGERDTRYRSFNLWFLVGTGWFIALMFAGISVAVTTAPSFLSGPWMPALALAPILAIVGGMIWFTKYNASTESDAVIGDRTPDENWIWGGVFYWNRDDPALIVEKRFGFGYTLNMAHPKAWLLLGFVLVTAVIATVVSRSD